MHVDMHGTKTGFISLLLAMSFIYTALLLIAYYLEIKYILLSGENELLLLKNYNSRELEIKRAVTNIIHHSLQTIPPSLESKDVPEYIASKLTTLESLEASKGAGYYSTYHLDINLWCGFLENESRELKQEILSDRIAMKCANCKDLDEYIQKYTLDSLSSPERIVEDIVPSCTPFLSYNRESNTITVSYPPAEYSWHGENPVIGISILDTINNISSIVIIPEGTIIT